MPRKKHRKIFITQKDKEKLEALILEANTLDENSREDLDDLQMELQRAKVVVSEKVPPYIVTMHSKVTLRDVDSSKVMTYTLVFPNEADVEAGAISVLAPVGTAILGYSEGDIVEWQVPAGKRRLCIEKILYQPEAAGDFDL